MKKLFRVFSRINGINYEGKKYDNVLFNWFVWGRKEMPIPGEVAIINYSDLSVKNKAKAEDYIKELFTEEEAGQLKILLESMTNGITGIEEIYLPVSDNNNNYNSILTGKGVGFTELYKRKSYNLSLKVRGLFNINDGEESVIADERPTVITQLDSNLFKTKK